ncbi:MAG: hypothetical protein WC325_02600 [Candidatus Bathyarchaeia archaeon]|jgi:hypothetical protein
MSKRSFFAVHEQKLKGFLEGLGLLESLQKGEIKCVVCEHPITLDNIGLIIPSGDTIIVCCRGAECMFMAKKREAKKNED